MNQKWQLPLWYHPTRVLLVDDDDSLLKGMVHQIDPHFPFAAFTNPIDALNYLKENTLTLESLSESIISDVSSDNVAALLHGDVVAINLEPLRKNLHQPNRFDKFVTVVVDKVMSEMDGLTFCRKVKESLLPVKLVLLTGNAGADEAVMAFNDGIIDGFVQKTAPNMMDKINTQIKNLATDAFYQAGKQLLGSVLYRYPLLHQKTFIDFFEKICTDNNIVEYYLLDSSCSYLLIDAHGKMKLLSIKSASDFTNAYDLYDQSSDEVSNALKNKIAFPVTGLENYLLSDKKTWKEKLKKMTRHPELDIYYAVSDLKETALSFDDYLEKVWQPNINTGQ